MKANNTAANAAFKEVYGTDTNLMTPHIVTRGTAGKFYYEISEGDFMGTPLFGVTLLDRDTFEKQHKLNKAFNTIDEARQYISDLRKTKKVKNEDQV